MAGTHTAPREVVDRMPIEWTNIKEAGYDARSVTLRIIFADGDVYECFDVPETIVDGLVKRLPRASSHFAVRRKGMTSAPARSVSR